MKRNEILALAVLLAFVWLVAFNPFTSAAEQGFLREATDHSVNVALDENYTLHFNLFEMLRTKGDFEMAQYQARSWVNPVVTREEVAALEWVKQNLPERTVFMSGIFGGELLMSGLREGTVGGDWAIIPNVVDRMYAVQYKFFEAPDDETAYQTALNYSADYVWAPNRQIIAGYGWVSVNYTMLDESPHFEKVFDNGAKIYKVVKQ